MILYRTNNQSAVLEDNLRRRGIPYRIYKGSSFYDHKEIRDMLAYIRLVINPRDDEAFRRIVNYPAGHRRHDRAAHRATGRRTGRVDVGRRSMRWSPNPRPTPCSGPSPAKAADFVAMIRSLSLARNDKGLYDFGLEIASRSGILAAYRAENTPEAASALDNIEELLNSMQEFRERCDAEIRNGERSPGEEATIEEWLQQMMLMTDMDKDNPEDRNKVTLMTVHSAKGLEYEYVYIVGMEENLFPSLRAAESADGIEEERRLFYVALTRAKVAATLSYAEMRFRWGNMEFSRPSLLPARDRPAVCGVRRRFRSGGGAPPGRRREGPSALDELRRRYDYRYQQRRQDGAGGYGGPRGGNAGVRSGGGPDAAGRGAYGGGSAGRSAYGGGRFGAPLRRRVGRCAAFSAPGAAAVATPRAAFRRARSGAGAAAAPLGGRNAPRRRAAGDGRRTGGRECGARERRICRGRACRAPEVRGWASCAASRPWPRTTSLVVAFDNAGEKTLLAKFAKLTKLG